MLKVAVYSILKNTTYNNDIITIVDNESVESETFKFYEEILNEYPSKVRVLNFNYPFNYSAINNFAASKSDGTILGLINNDVEVISAGWLTEMVTLAMQEDIGCVGAKLYYPDETIQHGGVIVGLGGVAGHAHKYYNREDCGYMERLIFPQELSAVTAACLLVRKNIFDQVNGLDELNLKVAFNDIDFCLRVKREGYRNVWTPYAELYHYESISRGAEDNPEKVARFNSEVNYMKATWGSGDNISPCIHYSPYLTLNREDFSHANTMDEVIGNIEKLPFRINN